MSNFTLYKLTSPSGKIYIGITRQKPDKRWGKGKGYRNSPHLRAAIEKYGWDAFKHEILAVGLSKEEAEQREVTLIAQYSSTDRRFGYNTDKGGSTGAKHSHETRKRIGEANRARVWTQEARHKLRTYKLAHPTSPAVAKKIGDANRGRKHRPESVEKIRAAQQKLPVVNLTTGEKYASVRDAARSCNQDASHIVAVCRGRRKSAGGAVWRYEKEVVA